jgi:hypothetical protein
VRARPRVSPRVYSIDINDREGRDDEMKAVRPKAPSARAANVPVPEGLGPEVDSINNRTQHHGSGPLASSRPPNFQWFRETMIQTDNPHGGVPAGYLAGSSDLSLRRERTVLRFAGK